MNNKPNKETERTAIKKLPREERPREKLLKRGAGQLSNTELIAILIANGGNTGENAISLAEKLLSMDTRGLSWFGEAAPQELMALPGVGAAKAASVAAAAELGKRIFSAGSLPRQVFRSPADAAALLVPEMRFLKNEVFRVVLLTIKNEIIAVEDCAVGNLNSAYVSPREVFYPAIKKGAGRILLAHNHPSGNPEPSPDDVLVTQRLYEAGILLGIEVIDHLVIGNGEYRSILSENSMNN